MNTILQVLIGIIAIAAGFLVIGFTEYIIGHVYAIISKKKDYDVMWKIGIGMMVMIAVILIFAIIWTASDIGKEIIKTWM